MGDAPVKTFAVSIALATAALTVTPTAHADSIVGNYRMDTNRDPGHTWFLSLNPCGLGKAPACLNVYGTPTPNGQAAPWRADAHLINGRYNWSVDVPDGVRCVVQFFPSHDVYSFDAVTLTGQVDSTFDRGCGDAPGGTNSYPFSLVRW
jgi:hypothetical protein